MRAPWTFLLGGLIVWAAHFLVLYALGEVTGRTPAAQGVVIACTLAALGADALIARTGARIAIDGGFDRWRRSTILLGAGLSALAVVWQTLPALV